MKQRHYNQSSNPNQSGVINDNPHSSSDKTKVGGVRDNLLKSSVPYLIAPSVSRLGKTGLGKAVRLLTSMDIADVVKQNLAYRDFNLRKANGYVDSNDMIRAFTSSITRGLLSIDGLLENGAKSEAVQKAMSSLLMKTARTLMVGAAIVTKLLELRRDKWDLGGAAGSVLAEHVTTALEEIKTTYGSRYIKDAEDPEGVIDQELLIALLTLPTPEFNRTSLMPFSSDLSVSTWSLFISLNEKLFSLASDSGDSDMGKICIMRQLDYLINFVNNYDLLQRMFPKNQAGTAIAANTARRNSLEEIATVLLAIKDYPEMLKIFMQRKVYERVVEWVGISPELDARVEKNFSKLVAAYDIFKASEDADKILSVVSDKTAGSNPLGIEFTTIPKSTGSMQPLFDKGALLMEKRAGEIDKWRSSIFSDAAQFLNDEVARIVLDRSLGTHETMASAAQIMALARDFSSSIERATSATLTVVTFELYKLHGDRVKEYNIKPAFPIVGDLLTIYPDGALQVPSKPGKFAYLSSYPLATSAARADYAMGKAWSFTPSGSLEHSLPKINAIFDTDRASLIRENLLIEDNEVGYYPACFPIEPGNQAYISAEGAALRDILISTAGTTNLTFKESWIDERFRRNVATRLSSIMLIAPLTATNYAIATQDKSGKTDVNVMMRMNTGNMTKVINPDTLEHIEAIRMIEPTKGDGKPYGLDYSALMSLVGHQVVIVPALGVMLFPLFGIPNQYAGLGFPVKHIEMAYGKFGFKTWGYDASTVFNEHILESFEMPSSVTEALVKRNGAKLSEEEETGLGSTSVQTFIDAMMLAYNGAGVIGGMTLSQLRELYNRRYESNYRIETPAFNWPSLVTGPSCLHMAAYSVPEQDFKSQLIFTHTDIYSSHYILGNLSFAPALPTGKARDTETVMKHFSWANQQADPSSLLYQPASYGLEGVASIDNLDKSAEEIAQIVKERIKEEEKTAVNPKGDEHLTDPLSKTTEAQKKRVSDNLNS